MALENIKSTVIIETLIFKNEKFKDKSIGKKDQDKDVVINFNDKHRIPVNRTLVFERCPFMACMEKHGFREAIADEIDISYDLELTMFKALMDYIHTGIIELSTDTLEEIMRAARYFQLDDLLKFCCDVFKQNINLHNVGDLFEIAKENALSEIKKAVLEFQVEHFEIIAKSHVFHEWTMDCIKELLSSDHVVVSHEKKVLKFLLEWLQINPIMRGQCVTDLFRKLRFSYLTKEHMQEALEASLNETLCQTLHQVAIEFSNKRTAPRIYHKGIYMLGRGTEDTIAFVRYWPTDGSVTTLKAPNARDYSKSFAKIVVNSDDIYMVRYEFQSHRVLNIHIEKYDVMKDTWTSRASTQINHINPNINEQNFGYFCGLMISAFVHQEKILVSFLMVDDNGAMFMENSVYCIKSDTWQTGPWNGDTEHLFLSSTSDGDCIYMQQVDTNDLLQFTPSTKQWIVIPCQENIMYHVPIVHKTMQAVLFLPYPRESQEPKMVPFSTQTKEFIDISFDDLYKNNKIADLYNDTRPYLHFTLFNECVYICKEIDGRIGYLKLDLTEGTMTPLPDGELKMKHVWGIGSIQ